MFLSRPQVSIEFMSFTIRVGKGHLNHEDDFETSCRADKCGIDAVRITGMSGTMSLSQSIMIKKALFEMGFTKILWERYRKDGAKEEITYNRK